MWGGLGGELDELAEKLLQPGPTSGGTNLGRVLGLLESELAANEVHELSFSKFNFQYELQLNDALKSMGLERLFDEKRASSTTWWPTSCSCPRSCTGP